MSRICPICAAHLPEAAEACPVCGAVAAPPPAAVTPDGWDDLDDLFPRREALHPDDPDAPTYFRGAAVPEVQSQWTRKAGTAGAWAGAGCSALLGCVVLVVALYGLVFGRGGSGESVLWAVMVLLVLTPLAALAGAVLFSCFAICLERPAAALARRLRRDGPVRLPPRSALARTDALGRRPPTGGEEAAISGLPDEPGDAAAEEGIQRKDGVERREG